jgi:hypothetical protein
LPCGRFTIIGLAQQRATGGAVESVILHPLGNPSKGAQKYFWLDEIEEVMADRAMMDAASAAEYAANRRHNAEDE